MTPGFIMGLLFAHWFGDFLCQTEWMSRNKSKNWYALGTHVFIYTSILGFFVIALHRSFALTNAAEAWLAINFVAHFVTDAITSRITTRLYMAEKYHWFFVVIGIDQFIHYATLVLTAGYFLCQL